MQIDQIHLKNVGPFNDARIVLPPGTNPDLADVYLLTGPNGSGKSTVLYALAGIIGCGAGKLGADLVSQRLRSADSIAAFAVDQYCRATAWWSDLTGQANEPVNPFGFSELFAFAHLSASGNYQSAPHAIHDYWDRARQFDMKAPVETRPKFSWAAIAYAGMRSVSDANVAAIQEPTDSPFENSLSFVQTADTNRLAQWIANQEFKRLKAKDRGDVARAEQLALSIRDIERIVAEIIDDEHFAFVTGVDDNNVRVRRNGVVIDMGLLPDGLKSIVSWIADLLMRLDRIPWIDDTPPTQRPFLLLLDEIDIHLHPSWQRKILPIVQRVFPKAQIIASTHSPFVVASVNDAHIITLKVENGVAEVEDIVPSQVGVSYSAVLRSIFGIESDFSIEIEQAFAEFHEAKHALLSGATTDRTQTQLLAEKLARCGEEVEQLIAIELRQLDRQLAKRGTP